MGFGLCPALCQKKRLRQLQQPVINYLRETGLMVRPGKVLAVHHHLPLMRFFLKPGVTVGHDGSSNGVVY